MIWREKLRSIKADVGLLMCGFTGGVTQTHILIIMGSSSLGLFFLLSSSSPELHCKVTKSTTNKTSQFSHFFLGGVSRCITKNGTVGAYLRKISNHPVNAVLSLGYKFFTFINWKIQIVKSNPSF